jgi:capping protein beta
MTEKQLDFALDLMRRLPPTQVANNLTGLLNVVPELTEDLLQSVDRPFKIEYDPETDKDFLLCDYNRDENSYRYSVVSTLRAYI